MTDNLRVALYPKAERQAKIANGVSMVNYSMQQHIQKFGITLVGLNEGPDIIAAHITLPSEHTADVIHCHGLYPTGDQGISRDAWSINSKVIDGLRNAVEVTVPSAWVAMELARDMGFWPTVVPHGIDLSLWPQRLPETYTGVVLWNKCRASDVCHTGPMNDVASILSDVPFISTFGKATDNVDVVGKMSHDEMRQVLYDSGVYLATTKETFGIGMLEAFAAGLPVVAWDWGAASEIITDGHDGFLVRPNNVEETAEAILSAIKDQERIGSNGRETAKRYTWDRACEIYADVYRLAYEKKKQDSNKLVTVVIPNYNYENYVGEAIDSVRDQTHTNLECLIVDDGSSDASLSVIREHIEGDPRCRVIAKENSGVADTRNLGAMSGIGAYITFLDADDRMRPHCLEKLLQGFSSRSIGISYGKLSMIGPDGVGGGGPGPWPGICNVEGQVNKRNQVPSCCMIRRDAFLRAGGIRSHSIPAEDAEFWTRIILAGFDGVLATDEVVYDYRLHQESATSKIRKSEKREPDWMRWLPIKYDGAHLPFAVLTRPKLESHPVIEYDQPVVSIIIPCGEAHKSLLDDALDSVGAQSDPRWECIVIDDTDEGNLKDWGIVPYITRYPWVTWLRAPKRGNVSTSRNFGVSQSKGNWLCFLDADDFLEPLFLENLLSLAAQSKEGLELFYTDWFRDTQDDVHVAEPWAISRLKKKAIIPVTFLHSRKAFELAQGFNEDIPGWEDWDYSLRLASCGCTGVHIEAPLFTYRYETGLRREECLERKDDLIAFFKDTWLTGGRFEMG